MSKAWSAGTIRRSAGRTPSLERLPRLSPNGPKLILTRRLHFSAVAWASGRGRHSRCWSRGTAAAATLRARGIDATILERGQRVGEPWRARYDRLHLHTIRWLSDLPGYRIPRDYGRWVARDQFVRYLEHYAAATASSHGSALRPRESAARTAGGVCKPDGTIPARVVVVASGYSRVPQLPRWPGPSVERLFIPRTTGMRGHFRARTLVVGAGNSGTEIAVDLAEGGANGFGLRCVRRRTSCDATPKVSLPNWSGSRSIAYRRHC